MFEVGFSEICLVALISLIVIGPEKLPQVARFIGFWMGKSRQMLTAVKQEFKEEIYAEEVRQLLQEQNNLLAKLNDEGKGLQTKLNQDLHGLRADLRQSGGGIGFSASSGLNDQAMPPQSPVILPPQEAIVIPPAVVPLKRSKAKKRRHGRK